MTKHTPKAPREKRPRNASATRADLLKAARVLFSRHGYEMVGLRQIAAEVGVNQTLVIRYFGSKLGLFTEVIEGMYAPDRWFEGDRKSAGRRMAGWVAAPQWLPDDGIEALTLLIQSCGHPEANSVLRESFDAQVIGPLAEWLGGRRAAERAGVLAALIIGAGMLRQVVHSCAFTGPDHEAVVASLGAALQRVVDDEPEPPPDKTGT